ncbi:hypothetical protein ANO11243_080730 [Dothideomycetidae sp. 11243]|nr:hypothetical protein ANO11243_080730 [fungal sp. No.11243]
MQALLNATLSPASSTVSVLDKHGRNISNIPRRQHINTPGGSPHPCHVVDHTAESLIGIISGTGTGTSSRKFLAALGEEHQNVVTEKTCIDLASEILGTRDISPVNCQGTASNTLVSADTAKVVHFRRHALDDDMLVLASTIYGPLTPAMTRHPTDPKYLLAVYVANWVDGDFCDEPDLAGPFPLGRFLSTTLDVAKFIGRGVHYPQPVCTVGGLDRVCSGSPSLATHVPELLSTVADVASHLHLLATLPRVLTHHDHGFANLLVDKESGAVTAVLDWDFASIEAFGMTVYSFYEDLTAHREGDKIHLYDQTVEEDGRNVSSVQKVLEDAFWQQLWESVADVLDPVVDGPAFRTAALLGALYSFFNSNTLQSMDAKGTPDANDPDHVGMMLRTGAYLPKMPPIIARGWNHALFTIATVNQKSAPVIMHAHQILFFITLFLGNLVHAAHVKYIATYLDAQGQPKQNSRTIEIRQSNVKTIANNMNRWTNDKFSARVYTNIMVHVWNVNTLPNNDNTQAMLDEMETTVTSRMGGGCE